MPLVVALVVLVCLIVVVYSFIRTGMWIFSSMGGASRRVQVEDVDQLPVDPFKPRSGWTAPTTQRVAPRENDGDTGTTDLPDRTGRW